jgi:DNA-directed RNA polymerase specialized sigma24 family protein
MEAASVSRGSTFSAGCPVELMAPTGTASAPEIDALFQSFITGYRGEALRAQLAASQPDRTRDEIEDAIQTACKCYFAETDGITEPGAIYKWIRTVAHRTLSREREHQRRQMPVDPTSRTLTAVPDDAPPPDQELIDRDDESDLIALTHEVSTSLVDRQRDVLALYGAGRNRPQIATHLDVSDRIVKRDLYEILDRARAILSRREGGGCDLGGTLIVRLACGLATSTEAAQAQLHLARCERCQQFHERLNLWREKVSAVLPIPASEQTDLNFLERSLHKCLDCAGSLRQHLVDGGTQVKQQAVVTYTRVADPTPLAGARPGTAVAVVTGCLAVGGAGAYCVDKGIDTLKGKDKPAKRAEAKPRKAKKADVAPVQQVDTTVQPQVVVEPDPEPVAPPPPPEPVEPAPQPPPEQSFEPSSPAYSPSAAQPSSTPAQPAPVADGGGGSSEFEP